VAAAWSTPIAIGLYAILLLAAQVPVARSQLVRGSSPGREDPPVLAAQEAVPRSK
jgi:hypothetical protein